MGLGREGEEPHLSGIAQVVPDLPTFAVDDGFSYRVPETVGDVQVGSVVRVPLGGRRVRGYVVGVRQGDGGGRKLKDVISVSGDLPVFDQKLLETLRWVSIHYVAPVAAVLAMAAPPNLPRRRPPAGGDVPATASPLPEVTAAVVEGRRPPPVYLVGPGPWTGIFGDLAGRIVDTGRNVALVLPTFAEANAAAAALRTSYGDRVLLASSSLPAKEVTDAWVTASLSRGVVVVGTREIALWPMGPLGVVGIVEEGRRAMKAPQTPTVSVRDVMRRRAAVERLGLVYAGPVPTAETVAAGVDLRTPDRRVWSLVEVIDRSSEPPGASVVLEATRRAIGGTLRRGGNVFVFVTRRGYAPAFRCIRCAALRRCPVCGSGPDRGDSCRRCGAALGPCSECGGARFAPLGAAVGRVVDDLRRSFGPEVGAATEDRRVTVGTERDLVEAGSVQLAVAVDPDALLLAPHYRASEDALRILARLSALVTRGRGNRSVLQTSMPEHPVFEALRRGTPVPFLRSLIEERAAAAFPPATQLLAVEVGEAPADADARLRNIAPADVAVFGPADAPHGVRWLVQGEDLHSVKVRLRGVVQDWRDAGARVRVDADPVDL